MSSGNRKPYETFTTLDQTFLDMCHDNLTNQLELIVDIEAPTEDLTYTNPSANLVEIAFPQHGFLIGDQIEVFESSDSGLVGNTYTISASGFTETTFRFDKTSAVSPSSGQIKLSHFLHLSDRNKYVGGRFYEARLVFPVIKRTIGEFLSPEIEFSNLTLEVNNADGRFNRLLPQGVDYDGWIGKSVTVKLGLRDVEATYKEIFRGKVTDEGGFKRSVKSFSLTARNEFDQINGTFPKIVFDKTSYPDIEDDKANTFVPLIYGDWTVNVEPDSASVPVTPVNGNAAAVSTTWTQNLECVISVNANTVFDTSEVYIVRGDNAIKFNAADIVNVNVDKNSFEIRQSATAPPAVTIVEGSAFQYKRGDKIYVKVKGKDLGSYDDNLIEQAKDILLQFGGLVSGDFDTNWATYRDKAAPAQSAISTFKSRVWIQQPVGALTYTLSMLEQVRLEAFIDRDLKLKLASVHFEDFDPNPTFTLRNWDIERGTFQPRIDQRNTFNRAKGVYNFLPGRNENLSSTLVYRNQAAIDQIGKEISKQIIFPNLYDGTTVTLQLQEILKLTTAYIENIDLNITWRGLLLDIGDFVKLNVDIQSTVFDGVPALIREVGYDPSGMKIPVRLWSFQMLPFSTWTPSFTGIVGGSTATISQE
jgi:hypothetical protein